VFATDTALVLAHSEVDEKSNEIQAAQALLAGDCQEFCVGRR
jgi:hypothetical protein